VYEAVATTDDSLARLARRAASLGYGGLVVRDGGAPPDGDRDLDVVPAVTVDADPDPASARVRAARENATVLCVRGGTPARNRFAVGEPRVDVLLDPVSAEEFPFDHVVARAAAREGVRVAFDLGPVLRETGGTRVRWVAALTRLHDLVTTYDAPHVVTAGATDTLGLRSPRALAAVGEAVGLSAEFVTDGLREWGRVAARNRDRASDDWVMPGVRRGRYDPADWDGAEGG
jgi:ribonuclease P/MRP protein subunit RPP1